MVNNRVSAQTRLKEKEIQYLSVLVLTRPALPLLKETGFDEVLEITTNLLHVLLLNNISREAILCIPSIFNITNGIFLSAR